MALTKRKPTQMVERGEHPNQRQVEIGTYRPGSGGPEWVIAGELDAYDGPAIRDMGHLR